jgi:acetylornithine deacetylase/succinyl-diaminopimelate desuccinylase-like protein
MEQSMKSLIAGMLAMIAAPALAAPAADIAYARELLGRSVAFATVEGRGQVPAYAAYLKGELVKAGFAGEDVVITQFAGTATLVATWRRSHPGKAKPIVLNAHMDVVEAKREDWQRDPFTLVEDAGYLFGRGIEDNKFDIAAMVTVLTRLKREGFRPGRDIVLALTGDEETAQKTTAAIAPQLRAADMVLNGDGGGGALGPDGRPRYYSLQTTEKTYADYQLEVTNPGGHSSAPRADNAIAELAAAISRIAGYRFPAMSNETTRAFFAATAKRVGGDLGAAMAAFATDPADGVAADTLSADPEHVGKVRTTCVPTMLSGGHAPNALPQRATANINCRIFPGTPAEDVRRQLQALAGDKVSVTLPETYPESRVSPLRRDLLAALAKANAAAGRKAVEIIPSMSAGTTDSVFFRREGIASYGVSGLYMKPEDSFAHGLDERVPADAIGPALDHYRTLITELAR